MKQILDEDRRATFDELEKKSGLSRGSLQRIVHPDFKIKKICARWVPWLPTEEQRQSRHNFSLMNLNMLEELGERFWH